MGFQPVSDHAGPYLLGAFYRGIYSLYGPEQVMDTVFQVRVPFRADKQLVRRTG